MITKYLIMGVAFLIVISSYFSLKANPTDKTAVYINLAAIILLAVIVTIMNLTKNKDK